MIRFVTGTDTGVGKTAACTALARAEREAGRRVGYFKPVQTGLRPGEPGDADFVRRFAGIEAEEGLRFEGPYAPSVAAGLEGKEVEVEALLQRAFALEHRVDLLLVEGAGGLLVPLGRASRMVDLAVELHAKLVVVTGPGLGTLNHSALTLEAARSRGLEIEGLVISGWPEAPGLLERSNLEALRGMAPVLGVLPLLEGLDVEGGRGGEGLVLSSGDPPS